MQKKLALTLFCATGLMLTTAFSSVYGMEETKTEHAKPGISSSLGRVVCSDEQKQKTPSKAPATGLFTQTELSDLQHILTNQFKTIYSAQEDDNEHAYLFVPNPELIPYAMKIYAHLYEISDQSKLSHISFFNDFNRCIETGQVPGVMLSFAIARFQAIRDEDKRRDPNDVAEEKSFVEHLPNPSAAIYSVLTRPSFKDDGTFYTLNDTITELQGLLKKPENPFVGAFGQYSFNVTDKMTNDVCKRLEKTLFTEIPPQVALPIVGRGYLPWTPIVKNLINDCFPIAFPFSAPNDDLIAHGLHFSDVTFSVHDFLHMLGDPRDKILYRYAESLLQESLEQDVSAGDAIPRVVSRVAQEYADFRK